MPWRTPPGTDDVDGFVPIELAQTGPRRFTLRADLVYVARRRGTPPSTVVVPAGFTTDLASVPFPLWAVIGPFGRHTRAAVVHDYGCSLLTPPLRTPSRYRAREAVDLQFREALLDSGVPPLRAWLMWSAVSAARVVRHGSVVRRLALLVQLTAGLVLLGLAATSPDGAWRLAALLAPLVMSAPWGRAWPAIALAHYAGALVLPALVVNGVTAGVLTLLGLAWRGRPGDIVPTRVGGA